MQNAYIHCYYSKYFKEASKYTERIYTLLLQQVFQRSKQIYRTHIYIATTASISKKQANIQNAYIHCYYSKYFEEASKYAERIYTLLLQQVFQRSKQIYRTHIYIATTASISKKQANIQNAYIHCYYSKYFKEASKYTERIYTLLLQQVFQRSKQIYRTHIYIATTASISKKQANIQNAYIHCYYSKYFKEASKYTERIYTLLLQQVFQRSKQIYRTHIYIATSTTASISKKQSNIQNAYIHCYYSKYFKEASKYTERILFLIRLIDQSNYGVSLL